MKSHVVMMPTYHRPEMLALALENLAQTPEADSIDVRICLDHCGIHLDEKLHDVEYVRDRYFPTAEIFHAANHVLAPSGSWNILNSLKMGYETGSDYVYLVEEDVIVSPDFFEKHQQMQQGDFFVTCGRQLPNLPCDYYTNPGTCYQREKLALVVPHINDRYFADMQGYLERNFPKMDDAGILDDGLIRRVMLSTGGQSKCAVPAIAAHQGFHYYNRMAQYKVQGSIEEKINQLRVILQNININDRYTKDFEKF